MDLIISATQAEPQSKKQLKSCQQHFGGCKRLEDDSVGFIAKCGTRKEPLRLKYIELAQAHDRVSKSMIKIEMLLDGSARYI